MSYHSSLQRDAKNSLNTTVVLLGSFLILLGILFNTSSTEFLFFNLDIYFTTRKFVATIICQVIAIGAGLWLIFRRPALLTSTVFSRFALIGLSVMILGGGYLNLRALNIINPNRELQTVFGQIYDSEELISQLTEELNGLNKSVLNLSLPDHQSKALFADSVAVTDLGELQRNEQTLLSDSSIYIHKWNISRQLQKTALTELQILQPLLDRAAYFEWTKFKIKKGHFISDTRDTFETTLLFDGVAHLAYPLTWNEKPGNTQVKEFLPSLDLTPNPSPPRRGAGGEVETAQSRKSQLTPTILSPTSLVSIKGVQKVRWKKQPTSQQTGEEKWLIYDWQVKSLKLAETHKKLFTEVLDQALPNADDLARARESVQESLIVAYLTDPENFQKPHEAFSPAAFDRHPGIAVVDIDRDGLDDIYVMARWGENMLFHNRGEKQAPKEGGQAGTFKEIAAEVGLNIKDHTSSAIFADFDNDGDPDVFLGRTLGQSMYLVNEDGRFVDRSDSMFNGSLPYLVSSVSVVDYNQDGLLDIYISTYASHIFGKASINKTPGYFIDLLKRYLPEAEAKQLYDLWKSEDAHKYLDRPGPPNMLLKNIGGGRFEIAASPVIKVYRNTYQSTWADFDEDGDPDVYLANDFAPNNLLRNDGPSTGSGQAPSTGSDWKFTDVTEQTGTADIGFGMGATWGDYDNDGDQDLYVTNMYSKAGQRITAQIAQLDSRFPQMARGNSLFRNEAPNDNFQSSIFNTQFTKVSGMAPPALAVEVGGWGWGSQFMDVDNDGFLDIYTLSGFYTVPKAVALPGDM